jgi:diaminobutyrate-2-oxoglutarate transaminase
VICYSNAFHGTSLGSLAVTANPHHRGAAGIPLEHVIRLPFDQGGGDLAPDLALLELLLAEPGAELPAAVILETVQGEGGVNVARDEWLRGVAALCRRADVQLIVDDVQMGCGRTGPFFSFEPAGIEPDIVCLSKSISGYGMPMALTLIRPELDVWKSGEHNGTFRGFNLAMVTGKAALERYWCDDELELRTLAGGRRIAAALSGIAARGPAGAMEARGRGLVHGLAFADERLAERVAAGAFARGLLVERAGPQDEVVKLLPPLTVTDDELELGLAALTASVDEALSRS